MRKELLAILKDLRSRILMFLPLRATISTMFPERWSIPIAS
jgi:hypothetical protein